MKGEEKIFSPSKWFSKIPFPFMILVWYFFLRRPIAGPTYYQDWHHNVCSWCFAWLLSSEDRNVYVQMDTTSGFCLLLFFLKKETFSTKILELHCVLFTIIFYGGFSERYLWMFRPSPPSPRLLTGNIWGIVFVIGCKHKNVLLGKHLCRHMQQAF